MKSFLNLGCGQNYLTNWTNVDFYSESNAVIQYDLRKGIPFPDQSFDFVYHSHVLEHFNFKDGSFFLKECYRVLKSGGIIRVVVPDLEDIVRTYLSLLDQIREDDNNVNLKPNYHWIKLELLDQLSRNKKGGEMVNFLNNPNLSNKEFIIQRIGAESKPILNKQPLEIKDKTGLLTKLLMFRKSSIRNLFKKFILSNEEKEWLQIGIFRTSGEVHQWMYDEVSLKEILLNSGFKSMEKLSAFTSNLSQWPENNLDADQEFVRKPDSLFMEARK